MDFLTLYQKSHKEDRRQQNIPVATDRRTGVDRRQTIRVEADPKLSQDIKKINETFTKFTPKADEFISKINKYNKVADNKQDKSDIENKILLAALSPIPFLRRFATIRNAADQHNVVKEVGKTALMFINVKEDGRDMKKAFNQLIGKTKISPEDADFQMAFSFFRGTPLAKLLYKLGDTGVKINKLDKTLYDTKAGMAFLKLIGWADEEIRPSSRKNVFGKTIMEKKIIGSSASKIVGRAMLRMPVLTMLFLSSLEIPSIYKEFSRAKNLKDNLHNGSKQALKSAITVLSLTFITGLAGAVLAKKGHLGSLIGIGIGSCAGTELGSYINNKINKD